MNKERQESATLDKDINSSRCPTRLLNDSPVDHDSFGGHDRIATAIADLIQNENGGRAIALMGLWGSGKSTIINLLKEKLEKSRDIALFEFDAWAHEGDPLRRSFLERLIKQLLEKRWLTDEKYWTREIDKLAKRLRIGKTKTLPRFTFAGTIMALVSMAMPIGLVLLNLTPNRLPVSLGLIISFLPLITLLILWFISLRKPELLIGKELSGKIEDTEPAKRRDLLSLIIAGQITEEKNESYGTPNPTSIEFQAVFTKALTRSLRDNTRQLVIVIDNLDRVATQHALSVWATMRTFFEFSGSDKHQEWMNRLWLLVPIAPETPKRLWRGEKTGEKSLSDEFIDKTFQVRFCVPLPVMSDWKEFFREQFLRSLPEHEADFYAVYRIFEKKRASTNRPPTPREIKLFLNKLGVYHRIWQHKISLPIQAWYVLEIAEKLDAETPESVLIKQANELYTDDLRKLIKEPSWPKYMAALYFNVEIDKALQVLIGDEVKKTLSSGQGKELKKLQEQVETRGFLTVLEQIVTDISPSWASNEPSTLARAGLALKELEQDARVEWQRIWRSLRDGITKAEWANLNEEVSKGLLLVLDKSPEEQRKLAIKEILLNISEPHVETEEEKQKTPIPEITEQWAKGLLYLLQEIHRLGPGYGQLLESFRIPGNADFYIEVMKVLAQQPLDNKLTGYLAPQADPEQVVSQFAALCQQGQLSDLYARALQLMLKLKIDLPLENLPPVISQRLNASNVLQPPEIKGCLRTLLLLRSRETPKAQEVIQQLTMQGHLMHNLHHAQTDNDAVALCLLPILEFAPAGNTQAQPGQAAQGKQYYSQILSNPADIIDAFTKVVCEFKKAEILVEKANEIQNIQRFVAAVLETIIQQGDAYKYLSSSSVVNYYTTLSDVLSTESLQNLITQLVKESDILRKVQEEFSENLASLYVRVFEASKGHKDRKAFIEFLIKELRKLPKETWLQELIQEKSQIMTLVDALVQEGVSIGLSKAFHDALLEHACGVLEGQYLPYKFRAGNILKALSADSQTTFLRNLCDKLIIKSDIPCASILKLYGEILIQSGVLKEEADRVVRLWFTKMLERQDKDELAWLEQTMRDQPEILTQSKSETQKTFRYEIRSALENVDEDKDVKQLVEAIAEMIDPELTQEQSEPETEVEDTSHKEEA